MTTFAQKDSCLVFQTEAFEQTLEKMSDQCALQFHQLKVFHFGVHLLFLALFLVELFTFCLFFHVTFISVFALAALFFTCFAYGIVLSYLQTKRTQEWLNLKNEFGKKIVAQISLPEKSHEFHFALKES